MKGEREIRVEIDAWNIYPSGLTPLLISEYVVRKMRIYSGAIPQELFFILLSSETRPHQIEEAYLPNQRAGAAFAESLPWGFSEARDLAEELGLVVAGWAHKHPGSSRPSPSSIDKGANRTVLNMLGNNLEALADGEMILDDCALSVKKIVLVYGYSIICNNLATELYGELFGRAFLPAVSIEKEPNSITIRLAPCQRPSYFEIPDIPIEIMASGKELDEEALKEEVKERVQIASHAKKALVA